MQQLDIHIQGDNRDELQKHLASITALLLEGQNSVIVGGNYNFQVSGIPTPTAPAPGYGNVQTYQAPPTPSPQLPPREEVKPKTLTPAQLKALCPVGSVVRMVANLRGALPWDTSAATADRIVYAHPVANTFACRCDLQLPFTISLKTVAITQTGDLIRFESNRSRAHFATFRVMPTPAPTPAA